MRATSGRRGEDLELAQRAYQAPVEECSSRKRPSAHRIVLVRTKYSPVSLSSSPASWAELRKCSNGHLVTTDS